MGLFDNKPQANGLMNAIRCDEKSYLIWKWRPEGYELGESSRENTIVWGSSIRVKDGSVAVFLHSDQGGSYQDYIEGPADTIVDTKNLPIISSIVGKVYGGGSPFQAEVYFINLAENVQTKFAVPYFDVFDSKLNEFSVPVAVRGTIDFNIQDYKKFIEIHRLDDFSISDLQTQIRDSVIETVKSIVANAPVSYDIPVIQLERKVTDIKNDVVKLLTDKFYTDYGVLLKDISIAGLEIDKDSDGYSELKEVTRDLTKETMKAQNKVNIKNLNAEQKLDVFEKATNLFINAKEGAYSLHKQAQREFADVLENERAGRLGAAGAKLINAFAKVKNKTNSVTPPPIPVNAYYVAENGKPAGPYDLDTLKLMIDEGKVSPESLLWKEGMDGWQKAEIIPDIIELFNELSKTPNIPDIPQ